jgi:hypothetical protein
MVPEEREKYHKLFGVYDLNSELLLAPRHGPHAVD